ncbi:23087_t:CDS:1, partial [Gigaspora rosea]
TPNDKRMKQFIQQKIVEIYIYKSKYAQVVLMGDFNQTVDCSLNRFSLSSINNYKPLPLQKWLLNQNFIDTFRYLHPTTRKYIWSNSSSKSRIDQIWISEDLVKDLHKADIMNMKMVTKSDHMAP